MMLELDRLDALDAADHADEATNGWLDLLRWVDREGDSEERGVAWQRRGLALARRERVAEAEDAYRRAINAWAASPGLEEQAGDAFLSLQSAHIVNGKVDVPDAELRPLAWSLRGNSDTPVARAERLVSEAMSNRLTGKLPEAMYGYWMAYALQRRSGSLNGLIASAAVLAELYEHAGQLRQAMLLYVIAGDGARAAKVLEAEYPAGLLAKDLALNVPRWERAAAYHVIGKHGRTLPPAYVAAHCTQILDEARGNPDGVFAPQPALSARTALATIALALPGDRQEATFCQLRTQLHGNFIDVIRASSETLILATNAGLTDATVDLLDLYLEDSYNLGVSPMWIAERASQQEDVCDRLRTEARTGHAGALEALAVADLIDGDDVLVHACGRIVDQAASIETITESHDGDQSSVSVGMGIRLEGPGILARSAPSQSRGRLFDRILEILADSREPEGNRASAVGALFNLAPALDADQAHRANEAIKPLALGKYDLSQWDENLDNPLSRFQINLHIPHVLRIAALGAAAQLVARHPQLGLEQLQIAVLTALGDDSVKVVAGALDAASRVPELELPFPLETTIEHADAEIRLDGFAAWVARHQELPTGELLARVRTDRNINVRLQLMLISARNPNGSETLRSLADNDPDAYVRAMARHHLSIEANR